MKTNTRRRAPRARKKLGIFVIFTSLLIAVGGLIFGIHNAQAALAELNPDDWYLELVFFDSTVNKGKDPVTNEQWIIDTSGVSNSYSRNIIMQVSYRNYELDRDYAPGELQIRVPNPFASGVLSAAQLSVQMAVSANNSSQHSYDWNYNSGSYNSEGFIFTNNKTFEAGTNLDGSIQVAYAVTSNTETREKYEDSCTHTLDYDNLQATMNGAITSNIAQLHYSRTYSHPWTRATYNITKTAIKLNSYDNLGEGADQYTWVRYRIGGRSNESYYMSYATSSYDNYIGLSNYEMRDTFPDDVKVLDMTGKTIEPEEDGTYDIRRKGTSNSSTSPCGSYYYCREVIVGYPKDVYNAENDTLNISNTVELRGTYSDRTEEETLATSTISLDLSQFSFNYTGSTIGIDKKFNGNAGSGSTGSNYKYYYQEIVDGGSTGRWNNTISTKYIGYNYDVQVGDDLVYFMSEDGQLERFNENEYFFKSVYIPDFKNANGSTVSSSKYQPAVYVRKRGQSNYELYQSYSSTGRTINFTENDQVVAWYVEVQGLTESITSGNFSTQLTIKSDDIAENGTIYNFNYIKYLRDGVLMNPIDESNYGNQMTLDTVGAYDQATYGVYLQRSYDSAEWENHQIGAITRYFSASKNANTSSPSYNPDTESFNGTYTLYSYFYEYSYYAFQDINRNIEQLKDEDWIRGINYYDLLPMGMELTSTPADIMASAGNANCGTGYYDQNGESIFASTAACKEFAKTHTSVEITKNWHETGRTMLKVKIDFSERPFTSVTSNSNGINAPTISFNYSIPYDSYVEIGPTYRNYMYVDIDGPNLTGGIRDTGSYDAAVRDINENGATDDYLGYNSTSVNLLMATSTSQDLQTSSLTEHSGKYDIEETRSGFSEDYSYKLRMRTGASKVTDAVIYDSIETAAVDGAESGWQGSFAGVDTSYAEQQLDYYDHNVKVKVWYSTNPNAGKLGTDSSWQAYDEATTDKSSVKALAFEYLDQEGNPAILTQGNYSYVIVKMTAPARIHDDSLAYNDSHSEWTVIDNLSGQKLDVPTIVDSNVTSIFLAGAFDFVVEKEWSDFDDYYELRPESVDFYLYKDEELVDTKTLDVANGETSVQFEGLPTAEADSYTVEEAEVEDYTSSFVRDNDALSYQFTNTVNRDAPVTEVPEEPTPEEEPTPLPDTSDQLIRWAVALVLLGLITVLSVRYIKNLTAKR